MLDSIKTYEKYDKDEVSFGIERLAEQVHTSWDQTRKISVPASMKKVQNVVLVGMGGSGIGAEIVSAALSRELRVPVTTVHDYQLPSFVSSKTLVILTSFSGDTEEVLSAAKEAQKKKAKMLVVTSGGKLRAFAKRAGAPFYQFSPKELAARPNLGMGFLVVGMLGLLERVGLVRISNARIGRMVDAMTEVADSCALNVETKDNPAKTVADALKGKPLLFVGSEHLVGSVSAVAYQVNEMAKQYAKFMALPELNHHFFESLSCPDNFFCQFGVLMVKSDHYNKRTRIRYEMTADLFEKLGANVIDYETRGSDQLEEVGEMMQFGSFLAYYLGVQNKSQLTQIPYVDLIKKKMTKEK